VTPSKAQQPLAIPPLRDVALRTAQEQVVETIRHAILGGVLEPGTRLVLAELATRLGVSATPIREAIRDLAAEGLVDFDSYKSAVVHVPTVEETQENYELMVVLEPIAVRRSMERITDEQVDHAETLHRGMVETRDDVGRWVELNAEFHQTLIDPAASPRLTRIIAGVRNIGSLLVTIAIRHQPSQIEQFNDDHGRILAAFRSRDADEAAKLIEEHLRRTQAIVEDHQRAMDSGEAQA
jgi:DNA-binding GntR family transcriptional regulator